MSPTETSLLIQQLLDDEISAADFQRLDRELRENPDALAAYRLYTGIHCGLVRHGEMTTAIRQVPVVPMDKIVAMQRMRVAKISLLATAAVVLLSGVILWLTMAPERSATHARFRVCQGSSFTLTHPTQDAQRQDDTLAVGSTVTLDHGALEITLPHQVRAILEAPATLTFVDAKTVRLRRGRAYFEVPTADGRGFTVETAQQKIVDLGTAFGVDLDPNSDKVRLHVLQGTVRVDPLQGKPIGKTITAPRSVSLAGTNVGQDLPSDRNTFLRHLPPTVETVFVEDFESGLLADTEYAIHMDPTAIRDHSGNPFQGIPEKEPWRFTTTKELRIRNPSFEEESVSGGIPVSHWQEVTGTSDLFNTASGGKPSATDGSLFLTIVGGRTLAQDLGVPIRDGSTYILTLDLKAGYPDPESEAVVRFFGSDHGFRKPLKEIQVKPTKDLWLRNQTLRFTATEADATGQTLGIALSSTKGRSSFDHLRICEIRLIDHSGSPLDREPIFSAADGSDRLPPSVLSFSPPPGASQIPLDHIPALIFNQPVTFGTGRVIVKNLTDEIDRTLVVGSAGTILRDGVLGILPPLGLEDDEEQSGGIPGWQSSGLIRRFNPGKASPHYRHPDLADDSKARGALEGMRGPVIACLAHTNQPCTLARSLGQMDSDRKYAISIGIGTRDTADTTPFAGYRIRLLNGSLVLAEISSRTPPGPPNSFSPVGLSWDSTNLPDGFDPDAPVLLEISTLAPAHGEDGYLDIDHVLVTSVGK
jgi:ferric-dicitrate binding protein FerR (iron transport regulator)